MDTELRELERQAVSGDPHAEQKLQAAKRRAGMAMAFKNANFMTILEKCAGDIAPDLEIMDKKTVGFTRSFGTGSYNPCVGITLYTDGQQVTLTLTYKNKASANLEKVNIHTAKISDESEIDRLRERAVHLIEGLKVK